MSRVWALTALIWALIPVPAVAFVAVAYLAAWALLAYLPNIERWTPPWLGVASILIAVFRLGPALWANEQWPATFTWQQQRAAPPLLGPLVVKAHGPQRFFTADPGVLRFGNQSVATRTLAPGIHLAEVFAQGAPTPVFLNERAIAARLERTPPGVGACGGRGRALLLLADQVWSCTATECEAHPLRGHLCGVLAEGFVVATATAVHFRSPEAQIPLGPARALAVAPDGQTLAVAQGRRLWLVDRSGIRSEHQLSVAPDRLLWLQPELILFSNRGDGKVRRWVQGQERPPIHLGRPVIAWAALGNTVYVGVSDFRPLDGGGNHQLAEQVVALSLDPFLVRHRWPLDGAGLSDLAAHDDGWVAVFAGSGEVVQYQAGVRQKRWAALNTPRWLAPLGPNAALILSEAHGEVLRYQNGSTESLRAPEGLDDPVRRGHAAFYTATLSGLSCASCHLDADTDDSLHDIGHGVPRPTLSVRGLLGTAPYLRGASYPSVAALHDQFALTVLGGYAQADPRRASDLEVFVAQLGRLGEGPLEPAGAQAFVKARCVFCHPPPLFTTLGHFPARYLFGSAGEPGLLDVPVLRGVGERTHLLHDGRGRLDTLWREHDPLGRHGAWARLNQAEQDALLRFLEAL